MLGFCFQYLSTHLQINCCFPVIQKPVNWFVLQIKWLVSIWWEHWSLMYLADSRVMLRRKRGNASFCWLVFSRVKTEALILRFLCHSYMMWKMSGANALLCQQNFIQICRRKLKFPETRNKEKLEGIKIQCKLVNVWKIPEEESKEERLPWTKLIWMSGCGVISIPSSPLPLLGFS